MVPPNTERDKANKLHNVLREGSKSFRYGFLFGMRAPRAGEIIRTIISAAHRVDPAYRGPSTDGAAALRRFEAATPGLKQLRESFEAQAARRGWVLGLDGRRVPTGAQYKALNRIVTSAEAIVCKWWLIEVYDELCARFRYGWDGDVVLVAWIHDELAAAARPEIADAVGEIMVRHAKAAGEHYKLEVPLDAAYTIGRSWAGDAPVDAEPQKAAEIPRSAEPPPEPQPITQADRDEINAGLKREGIAPINWAAINWEVSKPAEVPRWIGAQPDAATVSEPENGGSPGDKPGNAQAGNGYDRAQADARSDYRNASEQHADKPYAPVRAMLLQRGYLVAKTFPFAVPGEAGPRFFEDRYELRPGIAAAPERPRKTSRFWHRQDGKELNGTGPRRVIYNWPAIMRADAEAVIFITEGANKSEPLNAAGLLATAAPYHQWGPECVAALTGRHLIYHEDHDLPDESGAIKAKEFSASARRALSPGAASFRIVPALHLWKNLGQAGEPPHGWDVKDWLEQWIRCGNDPTKLLDICREISADGTAFTFIDMSRWDLEPAPEQEWIVYNRVPRRECVLFSGEGGAGKSIEQLHLSAAIALERDWLGAALDPGPVIFIDAEDDEKVLQRRTKSIAAYYDASVDDMIKGGLHLMSWRGCDAALATVARNGTIEATPLYKQLLEAAGDIKPVLIGIAASANVFAGNENDRAQVQQFVGMLTRVAMVANGSVVLISHPSLAGINTETGLSGTTQWHNSVRARYFMRAVKPADGEPLDTDLREIVFKKNNYGSISESIQLRWSNGLFLPVSDEAIDQATREATAQEVFLVLLKRFRAQNRHVSDKPSSNYAPALFVREQEAIGAGLTRNNLERAMRQLFMRNAIWNEPCGRPSRPSYRIAPMS